MGIYVKGMKMPKACCECRMYEADIYYCTAAERNTDISDSSEGRCSFCPLVPVPPHGRLIDADAYEKLLRGLGNRDYRREAGTLQDAIKLLHPHYAPTVIPAEESET